MNNIFKNLLVWLVIAIILILIFTSFSPKQPEPQQLTYTAFIKSAQQGDIASVVISERKIEAITKTNRHVITYMPMEDPFLLTELLKMDVNVKGKPPEQQSIWMRIFISWFPMLLLIGIWIFFMRQVQGAGKGGSGPFSFGRSKARMVTEDQVKVTFKDVAGAEEAKRSHQVYPTGREGSMRSFTGWVSGYRKNLTG
jgi:cell division protease FtsH